VSIPLWTLYVTVPNGLDLLRPFQWSVCECVQMDVRGYDFTWCSIIVNVIFYESMYNVSFQWIIHCRF